MNIAVYGAASREIADLYKEAGRELGRKMAERNIGLVFGGGINGMMGAVVEGVNEKQGYSLGVIPTFFHEESPEVTYKECSEYIYTDGMRERKREMEAHSDAFIIVPGGIGTMDEFFEILTLKQLGRHNKALVIYNMNGFYNSLEEMMNISIRERFIPSDCKELYKIMNNADEILDYISNYDPKDIDINRVKIR